MTSECKYLAVDELIRALALFQIVLKTCKNTSVCSLDTIQDFLCKLGMKPHMHLMEISISSLNHVITRPTKIIKDVCKAST